MKRRRLSRFIIAAVLSLLLASGMILANGVDAGLAAADDRRVAAMQSADRAGLEAAFSEQLRYAHSNGLVDGRESLISSLREGSLRYERITYKTRDFSLLTPDVATMFGEADFEVSKDGKLLSMRLSYLAVWRLESGQWRMVAWQSSSLRAPESGRGGA